MLSAIRLLVKKCPDEKRGDGSAEGRFEAKIDAATLASLAL
jgi:hypothetical protein